MWPFTRKIEKKSEGGLVQYVNGVYVLAMSGIQPAEIKDYVAAYKNCDTIFACADLIIQAATKVPWGVYRKQGDEIIEVDKHPLVDWMKEPTTGIDWREFCEYSFGFYQIAGNNYWRKNIGSQKKYGRVTTLLPQYVDIRLDSKSGEITAFKYNPSGRIEEYRPEEIVQTRTFNPDGTPYGLSAVQVVMRRINIDVLGQAWTISLLKNDARMSGVLSTEAALTQDQREAIQNQFKQEYAGYQNAGKVLVAEGGLKWQSISITPKELEFLNSDKINTRKICAAMKVPPELLGDNENKTYSNIKEARKAVYQEAAIPMLERFKGTLNRGIAKDFDPTETYYLDFDTSEVEALSEDLNSLWGRTKDALAGGLITRNEAREILNYEKLEGEDVLYEPAMASVVPISELGKPKPEPTPLPTTLPEVVPQEPAGEPKPAETQPKKSAAIITLPVQGGYWQKAVKKDAKWKAFHRRVVSREKDLQKITEKFLVGQYERAIDQIKRSPTVENVNRWELLNRQDEAAKYTDATIRWYMDSFGKAVVAGQGAAKGQIFDGEIKAGVFTPEHEAALRKMILYSGTKISEGTMTWVMDMLDLAEENSWTVEDLTQAIHEKIHVDPDNPEAERNPTWRARRIAHTESAKVENYGELEGYRETEFVSLKGWLCAMIETSRAGHVKADQDYSANPIPLDDDFMVDNLEGTAEGMAYPGDGTHASVGNVVNCLCTMFPQVQEA